LANILAVVIATAVVTIVGGGIGYLIWLKTRPKKQTWTAWVYQPSKGIKPFLRDKEGNKIREVKLRDLRPYIKDVIERTERDNGVVIYRLQKLNKIVPQVTAEVVELWGKNKIVRVVMEGDMFTLLEAGYHKDTRKLIFKPMPHDRINMMVSEMIIRKDRLKPHKDILQAITPWVVTGIAMMGLVAIAYFIIDGSIKINTQNVQAQERTASSLITAAEIINAAQGGNYTLEKEIAEREIKQEKPPPVE